MHEILQIVMGWTDSRLHASRVGRESLWVPDPDFPSDTKNERTVRLDSIAGEVDTIVYDYDFGDSWEYELKIEKIFPAEPGSALPALHQQTCLPDRRLRRPWVYAEPLKQE